MATADSAVASRTRAQVALVYAGGLLQGMALVSFPASSAVLTRTQGLTEAQYGSIFLPQVAFAVIGSIASGCLARKQDLKALLMLALVSNALSQSLLAASGAAGTGLAYVLVMTATAAAGLAVGLNSAPINSLPPTFFPHRRDAAVVAMHAVTGIGLAVGPLAMAPFVSADRWIDFPLLLSGLNVLAAIAILAVRFPGSVEAGSRRTRPPKSLPLSAPHFWLFAAIVFLYALAEGTFSNWAVIYLHEALDVAENTSGLAITMFWGALVAGRLAAFGLVARVSTRILWLALLALMIAAFLMLPLAEGASSAIGLFGFAGLACSAFFPLTLALVSRAFPHHVEWVSSMMIASLMIGMGLGSFAFGPLLKLLPFDAIYRASAVYPALAVPLALIVARCGLCRRGAHHSAPQSTLPGRARDQR